MKGKVMKANVVVTPTNYDVPNQFKGLISAQTSSVNSSKSDLKSYKDQKIDKIDKKTDEALSIIDLQL